MTVLGFSLRLLLARGLRMLAALWVVGLAFAPVVSSSVLADDERYELLQTDRGIIRLDRRTGEMAICQPAGESLTCRLAAQDRDALVAEIDRLTKRTADLEAQLKARGVTPVPPAAKPETPFAFRLPNDAEIDQMLSLAEKYMHRLETWGRDLERRWSEPAPTPDPYRL
jgi:hypothetical protein